jgi:HEAT repeat protein
VLANATKAQQHMILDALTQRHATTEIEEKIVTAGLASHDRAIQAAALRAAGTLGPTTVNLLEQLLQSNEIVVCAGAADALVKISPVSAIGILKGALDSTTHHVRVLSAGYLIQALEVTK